MTHLKFIKGIVKARAITQMKSKSLSFVVFVRLKRLESSFDLRIICVVSGLEMQGEKKEKDIT